MSWLSKNVSSALGLGGSILTGLFNRNAAAQAQADAQAYNTYVLQNRHQWEVNDLRQAGLNPILSAMNSAGGAGIGAAPAGSMPDLGSTINSSKSLRVQEKAIDNQYDIEKAKVDLENRKANQLFELQKSQIQSNNAMVEKLIAERFGLDIENRYKPKLLEGEYGIKLATQDMLHGQAAAGYATAADHYSHIAVNRAEVNRINTSIDSIKAAIPKMIADGKISNWEAQKLELYVSSVKKHPDLYDAAIVGNLQKGAIAPALGLVDSITGGYRNVFGGNRINDSFNRY